MHECRPHSQRYNLGMSAATWGESWSPAKRAMLAKPKAAPRRVLSACMGGGEGRGGEAGDASSGGGRAAHPPLPKDILPTPAPLAVPLNPQPSQAPQISQPSQPSQPAYLVVVG
jgi:hypothetical protein